MQESIEFLRNSILRKELVVLCGAGISFNSGLPLANPLRDSLLDAIDMKPSDRKLLVESLFPFEGYLEAVIENTNPLPLLQMFERGTPNANHLLIACLAKTGYLHSIYTTNFDLLIEKALDYYGLERGRDFVLHYEDAHFEKIQETSSDSRIQVYKIHGTVDFLEKMRITLTNVCARSLVDQRAPVVQNLFSTGVHRTILVLGYSFSDIFDINPQIRALGGICKKVILVEHTTSGSILQQGELPSEHVLAGSGAMVLKCDTDILIQSLWSSCSGFIGTSIPFNAAEPVWNENVHSWRREMEREKPYLKEFLSAVLMIRNNRFKEAKEYLRMLADKRKTVCDPADNAKVYINLAHCCGNTAEYQSALVYAAKGTELCRTVGDMDGLAKCNTNAGHVLYGQGEYDQAKSRYAKALEINNRTGNLRESAYCYANLGNVAYRQAKCDLAENHYQKALELHRISGGKKGEADALGGLGLVRFGNQDFEAALDFYEKQLEILRLLDNRHSIAKCHLNMGNASASLGRQAEARRHYDIAKNFNSEFSDMELELMIAVGLGGVFMREGNFVASVQHYERAKKLALRHNYSHMLPDVEQNLDIAKDPDRRLCATFSFEQLLKDFRAEHPCGLPGVDEFAFDQFIHLFLTKNVKSCKGGEDLDENEVKIFATLFPVPLQSLGEYTLTLAEKALSNGNQRYGGMLFGLIIFPICRELFEITRDTTLLPRMKKLGETLQSILE